MSEPIPAAALVVRVGGRALITGRRARTVPFLGGFTVFPGGRIDPADERTAEALFGGHEPMLVAKAAALRELLEETSLLLDGRRLRGASAELRARGFLEAVRETGARVDPALLLPAGRWITPEAVPIRFDTTFFFLDLEHADPPVPDGHELEHADAAEAEQILDRWRRLETLLAAPTLAAVEALAGAPADPARALADVAQRGSGLWMESISGIRQLPLLTPTLPPAQHTNCYLIGHQRLIAVDPATYDPSERARLLAELERLEARGAVLERVVLTHHHHDHIGSAEWLSAQRGVPIAAHPITRDLLADRLRVHETLVEGDVIDLGSDAAGAPFQLGIWHTPGHAPGHLVLIDRRPGSGAIVVGDMIAAVGTIIIDPPEGDMIAYLRELARLRDLGARIVFPAHGPGVLDGRAKLEQYIAHRRMREAKVEGALTRRSPATAEELLPDAYDDTPKSLYPIAARSCLAHLLKLCAEGRASRAGDRFSTTPSGFE
ncbi:MAG: MBL fold metallo-hydrolase [Deltaproteobacteria bacterium]|nr:MBL fold metallo-hydrolase [Deltaproteobacteria bacterium]